MELLVRDTCFSEPKARLGVLKLWKDNVVGLVGSSSSNPTAAMAEIAGKDPLYLAQVGFRPVSDLLSDPQKYPLLIHVNSKISDFAQALGNLLLRRTCASCAIRILLTLDGSHISTQHVVGIVASFISAQPYPRNKNLVAQQPCWRLQTWNGLV